MRARRAPILLPLAALLACGKPPERGARAGEGSGYSVEARRKTDAGLSFVPPNTWGTKPPSSSTRLAEYAIPRAAGDGADGELALSYFGEGQGGTVEMNLDRWIGQFQQPDGSSSKGKAKVDRRKVADLPVTIVEVSGRFVSKAMFPGQRDYDEAGWRLHAAIVETAKGPFFLDRKSVV